MIQGSLTRAQTAVGLSDRRGAIRLMRWLAILIGLFVALSALAELRHSKEVVPQPTATMPAVNVP